jgi:hypothetical protein
MVRHHIASLSLVVLLVCVSMATPSAAQWGPAGVTVCTPPCESPLVVSDGAGGCFVGWNDLRTGDYDVYVQHLDATGRRVANWPEKGFPICTAVNAQGLRAMAADGLGGAFLAWVDERADTIGIYVGRVQDNGTLSSGWPVNGVRVMAHFLDDSPQIFADSSGGVYVAVRDFRTTLGPTGRDIYVQHLDAFGHPAPGWGADGKPVALAPGHQDKFRSCRDGTGGLYFVWDVDGSGHNNVHCQRVLPNGDPAPGWPSSGKQLYPGLGTAGVVPRIVGGATIVVVDAGTNSFLDLSYYTLGVDADGNRAGPWASGPKAMVDALGDTRDMIVVPDGAGGLYGTWMDSRNYNASASDVFVQRIDGSGNPASGWPANGVPAIVGPGFDGAGITAADIHGGAYVVADVEVGIDDDWVAHLTGTGTVAGGWTPGGQAALSSPTHTGAPPAIAADDRGGAFVALEQLYPPSSSHAIVVQHFGGDVPTGTTASMVAADAFSDHVALDWFAAGTLASATVERHVESGDWQRLATVLSDGTGHLRYLDSAVTPGMRYAYRLTYSAGGALEHTPEAWVNVPVLARFALAGAVPNPAPGRNLRVMFSLPSWQPAELELYDLTGRRVSARDVGTLGPGEHSLQLAADMRISPGMYWLRLSQGSERSTARIVVAD